METLTNVLGDVSGFIWGPVMLVLLMGTGLYLSLGLRGMTLMRIPYGFRMMWRGRKPRAGAEGEITPFNALATALGATIGTGNIAGVATAIYLGGPGAIFWMWVTALFGMATKYAEAVLAVHYRETDKLGNYVGGPMYYIKNGLGDNWKWLGFLFAFAATIAAFGIGNTIQANSVAQVAFDKLDIPYWVTAVVLAGLTFVVIIGGIKRVGEVAGKLVPIMAILYVLGALVIIAVHIEEIPAAISLIFTDAFTGTAAAGGFAGSTVMMAVRFGVARGIFSNEAGLGSAPIAHAAAQTKDPVRQGTIGMLGTFIDTIVVCSMTAFVILSTNLWQQGQVKGVELTTLAMESTLGVVGRQVVSVSVVLFAVSTIVGYAYYGRKCFSYLFGKRRGRYYDLFYLGMLVGGAVVSVEAVVNLLDTAFALMALPNMIATLLLAPRVMEATRDYLSRHQLVPWKSDPVVTPPREPVATGSGRLASPGTLPD